VGKPRLAGKVVVVPMGGAAVEQAPALARRLAAEGATVVFVAAPDALERCGRFASEIQAAAGGRPAVFALDSADDTDPAGPLLEFLVELFGKGPSGPNA
jgi:NAD(P)-dependent dehydrogenase (short-subunit alcohol dehydrogenase family)